MMRRILFTSCLFALSLLFTTPALCAAKLVPLYWYQNQKGYESYTVAKQEGGNNPEEFLGQVGYVYDGKMPGTVPLYSVAKEDKFGFKFFFTIDLNMVKEKEKQGYAYLQIICYVSPEEIPGKTKAAYRAKFSNSSTFDKVRFDGIAEHIWKQETFDAIPIFYIWNNPTTKEDTQKTAARKEMINQVYLKAMGRNATTAEKDYWLPKNENFNQLVAASREWLYSTDGAKDWVATVQRAMTIKLKRQPTEDESWNALAYFDRLKTQKNKRMIYDEMVHQLQIEKNPIK